MRHSLRPFEDGSRRCPVGEEGARATTSACRGKLQADYERLMMRAKGNGSVKSGRVVSRGRIRVGNTRRKGWRLLAAWRRRGYSRWEGCGLRARAGRPPYGRARNRARRRMREWLKTFLHAFGTPSPAEGGRSVVGRRCRLEYRQGGSARGGTVPRAGGQRRAASQAQVGSASCGRHSRRDCGQRCWGHQVERSPGCAGGCPPRTCRSSLQGLRSDRCT